MVGAGCPLLNWFPGFRAKHLGPCSPGSGIELRIHIYQFTKGCGGEQTHRVRDQERHMLLPVSSLGLHNPRECGKLLSLLLRDGVGRQEATA